MKTKRNFLTWLMHSKNWWLPLFIIFSVSITGVTFNGSPAFQTMTWLRIVGGSIFCLGGVFPLVWFIITRIKDIKSKQYRVEPYTPAPEPAPAMRVPV